MSDNVPLEIQQEIIKWVPLKPLLQFRSVSKAWKSLIDSSKFINAYHIIHKHPQRLLLKYESNGEVKFCSIIDDGTFPQNTSFVPVPKFIELVQTRDKPLRTRDHVYLLGCSNGLFCFKCFSRDTESQWVVLWNSFLKKTVDIVLPRGSKFLVYGSTRSGRFSAVGFGVCPETSDVKLVLVNPSIQTHWEAKIFTLSSRAWRSVSFDPLFKSCDLSVAQVSVNGFIYMLGYDDYNLNPGIRSNLIVSFDLKSEVFRHVHLPDILVHSYDLRLYKRNECLTVLECSSTQEGERCVWMMKDGVTESFTKMFTIKSRGPSVWSYVLGYRKNGEAIFVTRDDDTRETRLEVYNPCSGHLNDTGIVGIGGSLFARSYVETLLLLDQPDSMSH